MAQAMGGRVAESVVFGKISTGAKDDLQKITKIAYLSASTFGMAKSVGHLSFPIPGEEYLKPYSEDTAQKIDEEAKNIINNAYNRAEYIIKNKMNEMVLVSNYLLENEQMSVEKFKEIVGERIFLDI
jgi:AFG3 family protein